MFYPALLHNERAGDPETRFCRCTLGVPETRFWVNFCTTFEVHHTYIVPVKYSNVNRLRKMVTRRPKTHGGIVSRSQRGGRGFESPLVHQKSLAEKLCRARLLTGLDIFLLEVFCQQYAAYRRADAFLKANGEQFVVTNSRGQLQSVREFPAVSVRRSCAAQMAKIARELGLSPAGRALIDVPALLR